MKLKMSFLGALIFLPALIAAMENGELNHAEQTVSLGLKSFFMFQNIAILFNQNTDINTLQKELQTFEKRMDQTDSRGQTILFYLLNNETIVMFEPEKIKLLLDIGAKVNVTDKFGNKLLLKVMDDCLITGKPQQDVIIRLMSYFLDRLDCTNKSDKDLLELLKENASVKKKSSFEWRQQGYEEIEKMIECKLSDKVYSSKKRTSIALFLKSIKITLRDFLPLNYLNVLFISLFACSAMYAMQEDSTLSEFLRDKVEAKRALENLLSLPKLVPEHLFKEAIRVKKIALSHAVELTCEEKNTSYLVAVLNAMSNLSPLTFLISFGSYYIYRFPRPKACAAFSSRFHRCIFTLIDTSEPSLFSVLENQRTPLKHAITRLLPEVVTKMVEKGADVDIKDSFGETALHIAAYFMFEELACKALVNASTNLSAKNAFGQTPLDIAKCFNNTVMISCLEKKFNS